VMSSVTKMEVVVVMYVRIASQRDRDCNVMRSAEMLVMNSMTNMENNMDHGVKVVTLVTMATQRDRVCDVMQSAEMLATMAIQRDRVSVVVCSMAKMDNMNNWMKVVMHMTIAIQRDRVSMVMGSVTKMDTCMTKMGFVPKMDNDMTNQMVVMNVRMAKKVNNNMKVVTLVSMAIQRDGISALMNSAEMVVTTAI
jgi:hypothetical protein